MAKTKILIYDIEVSRETVQGYRNGWDFKVVKQVKNQELMCFAYKWLGEKKVHYVSRNHVGGSKALVEHLWRILDEADIAIGHNSNGFDNKMSNRFFLEAGLGPVSPYKSIDTYRSARNIGKFPSYGLDALSKFFGFGQKKKIGYADLEDEFMDNPSAKVERLMKEYNIEDVVLTEKLYMKLRPYIKNHTNLGDLQGERGLCPKCGSSKLEKRGIKNNKQEYQCKNCYGWCNDSSKKTLGRIVNS